MYKRSNIVQKGIFAKAKSQYFFPCITLPIRKLLPQIQMPRDQDQFLTKYLLMYCINVSCNSLYQTFPDLEQYSTKLKPM